MFGKTKQPEKKSAPKHEPPKPAPKPKPEIPADFAVAFCALFAAFRANGDDSSLQEDLERAELSAWAAVTHLRKLRE